MSSNLADARFFDTSEAIGADPWTDDDIPDAEPASPPGKSRGNRYVARQHIERYWELRALRSHLDDFEAADPDF